MSFNRNTILKKIVKKKAKLQKERLALMDIINDGRAKSLSYEVRQICAKEGGIHIIDDIIALFEAK